LRCDRGVDAEADEAEAQSETISVLNPRKAFHGKGENYTMPAFALVPASPSDLEAVARVQFEACAQDHGFPVIFPKGPTLTSITHFVQSYESDMESDLSCYLMVVKDALTGDVASFAIWHFYPPRSSEEVEEEMLMREFPLPSDANKELGNRVIHNSIRKRHEVVASAIGTNQPYACKLCNLSENHFLSLAEA
jgi:hypothetical protein